LILVILGLKANTSIRPKTYITLRDWKGGRKMGFYRGAKGRFGGRFCYGSSAEGADSEPIMILPSELGEPIESSKNEIAPSDDTNITLQAGVPAQAIIDSVLQQPATENPSQENELPSSLHYEPAAVQEEQIESNDIITQKNISVNYSGVKPKTNKQSTGNSSQKSSQNQHQNQTQGPTTPKTIPAAKKASQKTNHQHDKKTNYNANTPKAMKKAANAKEKALKKVNRKVALIKARIPQR
jgi:hypothetical protein